MIVNVEQTIVALKELEKALHDDIVENRTPSDLTLARVVDLSRVALPGDTTYAVIGRVSESGDALAAHDLTKAAIQSLMTGAVHALAQPESAPHLQSLVTQAVFNSRWIRYSILGLIVAYAVAVALLVTPIREVFGDAGKVAEALVQVKQTAAKTEEQLESATRIVKDVSLRIDVARSEYGKVEERIGAIRRDVESIDNDIKSRKARFERDVSAVIATVRDEAKIARAQIAEVPARADARTQEAFAEAEKLARERMGVIRVSVEGHQAQNGLLGKSITALGESITAHTETLEMAVAKLKMQEEAAAGAFDAVPGRVEALFEGRDKEIDTRMVGLLAGFERRGGEALSTGRKTCGRCSFCWAIPSWRIPFGTLEWKLTTPWKWPNKRKSEI
jgi:hypothetical protein